MIRIFFMTISVIVLLVSTSFGEIFLDDIINIGNTYNALDNVDLSYSKTLDKFIVNTSSGLIVFDPETLCGIEKNPVDLPITYSNRLLINSESNSIYLAYYSENRMFRFDEQTRELVSSFDYSPYRLNAHNIALDKSKDKIYFTTRFDKGMSANDKQYLFCVDGSAMTEDFKLEIPKKVEVDIWCPVYTTMYVDEKNSRLFLAFHDVVSELPQNSNYYKTHHDSIYVYDIIEKKLLKTIPIAAGPKYITKNNTSGKIYVLCDGEYIYPDGFPDKHNGYLNDKAIVSVIDDDSYELITEVEFINNDSIYPYEFNYGKIAVSELNNLIYCAGSIIDGETDSIIASYSSSDLFSSNARPMNLHYDEKKNELYELRDSAICVYDGTTGERKKYTVTGSSIGPTFLKANTNEMYFVKVNHGAFSINSLNLGNNISNHISSPGVDFYFMLAHDNSSNLILPGSSEISLYDLHTNSITKTVRYPDDPYHYIRDSLVNQNNNRLYVLCSPRFSFDSHLYVFDATNLDLISDITLDMYIANELELDTENNMLFICSEYHSTYNDKCKLIALDEKSLSIQNESMIEKIQQNRGRMIVNSETNQLITVTVSNQVNIYDTNTLDLITSVNPEERIYSAFLVLCEELNRLYVCNDYSIITVDLNEKIVLQVVTRDTGTQGAKPYFNTNDGRLYVKVRANAQFEVYNETDYPGYSPPSSPSSLTATPADAVITISWPPVDHPDVQGYKVYRSPAGADQWTKLNTELVTHTSFLDETATPNTPYDYHVCTTGLYNISSDPSDPVSATLTINPDFSLSSILSTQSTEQGTTIDYIITSESIEQFATLIDLTVEGLLEDLTATLSTTQLRPGDVASLTVDIAEDFAPDIYEFEVVGIADGIEHRIPLTLNVVETEQQESAITLSLSSNTIEFGDAIFATGRIIPEVSASVSFVFMSSSETRTVSTTSLSDGTFSLDFEPETSGEFTVEASWAGNDDYSGSMSEPKVFDALSGQTKITCTTDVSADAELGWQMTIKGTVFPNPGVGDVVLYVIKPDGTKETIDGLKINELGYYGYNITADQPGFWEVTAGWAGNSRYLGSVSETLIVPYGLDIGRAIIVVSPKQNRPFYYTANRLGNLAYQTFSKRRFDNPRIKYFDNDTSQDLNEDGFTGDVDGEPTLENVTEAISTWSAAAVNDETPLCIYLIGEGSLDGIELSDGNILTANLLGDLLSDVETTTGCDDVIVVVDAPHSGKFVSELSKFGRCVVTSTNFGKSNYVGHGKLSFSQYFLNYAYQGKSLRDSFLYTKRVLSNLPGAFKKQEPQVEGEGNLFANESSDFLKTANWYFGSSYGLQDLMPRVKSMSLASVTGQGGGVGKIVTNTHDVLSGERTPSLKLAKSVAAQGVDVWVRVDDAESNISSVFATVFSPQDSVLQEVELFDPESDGKYEGIVYGLDDIGAYDIVAYAFDESENVSEPMKSLVMVVEREVVLEPPTDVRVDDVPGDNGYQVNVSWITSSSENDGDVGWYRIYRSRKSELTNQIPLSQFTSIDTLNYYEEIYTILVDSVAVGQTEYVDSVPLNGVNYYYWVQATGPTGASKKVAADTPTFVEAVPTGFIVHQPYPNPFNPSTTIHYELPTESHVEFVVYDVLGRKVKVLEDGMLPAGAHEIVWNGIDERGNGVGSGMYFYQVKAGDMVRDGKMVLVR